MAQQEVKKILTIDARASLKTLRELQTEIDKLRRIENKDEKELVQLKAAQTEYNRVMRLAVKETNAAAGSYNALVVQLAKLKEQWKATASEAERGRLTKEINKVKAQLNDLDHSIGNWQRNVGNYWGSIRDGLGRIAVALVAVRGAFKTFQSAMESTQSTGDALRNTIDSIKSSYNLLMTAVVSGDWSAFSGGFWAVYDAAKAAAEAIDQLKNAGLAYDYLTQTNQTKFNQYYNIWKDKASTEEMKKDAQEQMRAIIQAQYDYAAGYNATALDAYKKKVVEKAGEQNLDILRVTVSQFRKAMEMDVSLDPKKARADNERQYKEYLRKLNEYQGNNLAAQEKLKKQYADVIAIHAMLELMKDDELKGLADILTGMERATQAAQGMERRMLRAGGSSTTTTGGGGKSQAEKDAEKSAQTIAGLNDWLTEQVLADIDKEIDAIDREIAEEEKLQQTRFKSASARRGKKLSAVDNNADASVRYAQLTITDEQELAAEVYRIRKEANEQKLALLRQFAQEAYEAGDFDGQAAYWQQAADLEVKIATDAVNEKIRLRKQDTADAKKAQKEQRTAMQQTAAMFGNVASAYQAYITQRLEGGKISEAAAKREFAAVKDIQYAQTWINTLAGMMSVWAGEGTTATKIATSAAVFTQGLAATMQIANTTLGSVAAAAQAVTSAAVAAPVVINAMPQVQAVTSASQEQVLNERAADQRVYVVYSDIAQAGRKVRVTDSESRF